jgi:hypothetical protein
MPIERIEYKITKVGGSMAPAHIPGEFRFFRHKPGLRFVWNFNQDVHVKQHPSRLHA